MKTFFSLLRVMVVMAFCQSAAAGNIDTRDYRQLDFADAMRKVEGVLSWHSSNSGMQQFDIRYIGTGDPSASCVNPDYQQVTIAEAYEFAGVANSLPLGELRIEITGSDGNGGSRELLVLAERKIDDLPVVASTYRDYSSFDYATASSKFVDQYLGWYETNRDVERYSLTYTDPTTGAVKVLTATNRTDLRNQLDALGAGNYQFELELFYTDGKFNSRFVALNKLPVDVTTPSVDLQLAWTLPTQREDGSTLASQDIAGYEVYMTMIDGNNVTTDQVLSVSDASQTSLLLADLTTGQYHLAISAIDTNGLKSQLSDVVSYTVN